MPIEVDVVTKMEAAKLRKALQQATRTNDEAWWEQCKLLHQVHYSGYDAGPDGALNPLYVIWGHESWHDYVEEELGLHVGTANRMVACAHFFLVRIAEAFKEKHHLLSRQRMLALASHPDKVTKATLNQWVTQARNMSVCQLEHKLDGRKEPRKSFSLQLSVSEHKMLSTVLDDLMATGEYASRKEALFSLFAARAARTG